MTEVFSTGFIQLLIFCGVVTICACLVKKISGRF